MYACFKSLISRTPVIYEGAMHTVCVTGQSLNQYYYYINNNRLDVLFELIQESIITGAYKGKEHSTPV